MERFRVRWRGSELDGEVQVSWRGSELDVEVQS